MRKQFLFLIFAMLTGFCMCAEYALTKPTANSVFIATYGAHFYPYVWLATIPLNLLIVGLYNRFVAKIGPLRMLTILAGFGMVINASCAHYLCQVYWLPFAFYLWKDVYILIMLQQLWSIIHATITVQRSKYLYVIIFGIGGLGSMTGSLIPSLFAIEMGSAPILLFNLPLYAIVTLLYAGVVKTAGDIPTSKPDTKETNGLQLIFKSRILQFILLIVVLMQVASSLVEYQFNTLVEQSIIDQDVRTAFYGKLWSIIHSANLCLQFVGSFLLVKILGLRRSHILVPSLLLLNSIAFLALPTLGVMCVAYGTVKAFDYSLFAILKEMLYVPLSSEEKFKAKAIIDVFAYRSSKALASFVVLFLQLIGFMALAWTAFALFAIWALVAFRLKRDETAYVT